jgi:hypothetical protein
MSDEFLAGIFLANAEVRADYAFHLHLQPAANAAMGIDAAVATQILKHMSQCESLSCLAAGCCCCLYSYCILQANKFK